ncbi:response regulator [Leucobacter sp. HNU]|uniref:response regulator n=1 Tax=Leucobacter sp. HNU TaxID=3236805 RepID=UPI003A8071C3
MTGTGPAPIRVLVVDDQDIVRDGLVTILDLSPELAVVGEAATGERAVELAGETRPDVVLMDLRMPGIGGVEATRRLRSEQPGVAVLVLTTFDDGDSLRAALAAGARGFLTKDAGRVQLVDAIRSVARGGAVFSDSAAGQLVRAFVGGGGADSTTGTDSGPPVRREAHAGTGPVDAAALRTPFPELTPREREVLAAIASGASNAEIAASFFISIATVKSHVNALFAKLGASSRAEAIGLVRDRLSGY